MVIPCLQRLQHQLAARIPKRPSKYIFQGEEALLSFQEEVDFIIRKLSFVFSLNPSLVLTQRHEHPSEYSLHAVTFSILLLLILLCLRHETCEQNVPLVAPQRPHRTPCRIRHTHFQLD